MNVKKLTLGHQLEGRDEAVADMNKRIGPIIDMLTEALQTDSGEDVQFVLI